MKLVILSGGVGKRLWPISNEAHSKQFLQVISGEGGQFQSMLQRTWKQIKLAGLSQDSFIVANKAQIEIIHRQLDECVNVIEELYQQDTFPAISLASVYLYHVNQIREDEVIVVLPIDLFVENRFFEQLKTLERAVRQKKALGLIGVRPTYPSEQYGYIVPNQNDKETYPSVCKFVEKPEAQYANKLIQQGALWNCGVFAFELKYMISLLTKMNIPTNYDLFLQRYQQLPKISFDYEVVEKEASVFVFPYNGYWKDLGTWDTLTEEIKEKKIGHGITSLECHNTHVINQLNIPMVVLGISNCIVAASPQGILVANKEASRSLKKAISNLDQRPMYEERRWGTYRVLDFVKMDDGQEVLTKRIHLDTGKNISYQKHENRSEVWTIISGEGELILNEQRSLVRAGSVVEIPVGMRHGIKAQTDLQFIEVQIGSPLIEEDIIRICYSWEEAIKLCEGKENEVEE